MDGITATALPAGDGLALEVKLLPAPLRHLGLPRDRFRLLSCDLTLFIH